MSRRHSLLFAAGLSALLSLCSLPVMGQPAGPGGPGMGPGGPGMGPGGPGMGPDGGGVPFDPENPPQEPVKPVPPARLELPVDWLGERDKLLKLCDNFLDVQFADLEASKKPTDNPLVQRFRECLSEKYIVSEWARERPLDIDWTYPVLPAERSIKEIGEALQKTLEAEAEAKFPLLEHDEYVKIAHKKYRMYRTREMVEIPLLQGGRGVVRKRRGRFLGAGNGQVKLAPRQFISRMDMSDEVAARFFRDAHVAMVKKYADNAVVNCKLHRTNYVRFNMYKQMPVKLKEAQYVPNHVEHLEQVSTKSIFKPEQWCSRQELVLKQQKLLWEKNLGPNSLGDKIKHAFMRSQGFIFLSDKDSEKYTIAFRADEENRHKGWIKTSHYYQMVGWIAKYEKYNRDLANYDNELQRYREEKIRWDEQKKQWDQMNGGGDEEEGEE